MSESLGEFRWEPPCHATISFDGTITEDQARYLLQQTADHSAGLPYVLMTVDISRMDKATPESRRVSAQIMKQMPPRVIAVIGGTFSQRIVSKLVLKATEILGGGLQASAFFRDEDEAKVWLDEQTRIFESTLHRDDG
ncbi:MAG: STAS/SEC14 domain-containing protein [Myxococcales bacterium]|nr:STAS/SEC14 domain-containing protein [Myxococcales bacterium]